MIILFTVFSGAQPEHVCHSLVDKGRGHFLTSSRGSAADGCVVIYILNDTIMQFFLIPTHDA